MVEYCLRSYILTQKSDIMYNFTCTTTHFEIRYKSRIYAKADILVQHT